MTRRGDGGGAEAACRCLGELLLREMAATFAWDGEGEAVEPLERGGHGEIEVDALSNDTCGVLSSSIGL